MQYTAHYNMAIAEGSDVVNPLTQIFPNFSTIDAQMYSNANSGVGVATEVTTGNVHAIVRGNTNNPVFRFTATSAWAAGDSMTVDGNAVTVHLTDGQTPPSGAYIIGSEVLAILNGALVTLICSAKNERGVVSVSADGVKTFTQLLNDLDLITDRTKIKEDSVLVFNRPNYNVYAKINFKHLVNGTLRFAMVGAADDGRYAGYAFNVVNGSSRAFTYSNDVTPIEISDEVPGVGDNFIIYY